MVSVHLRPFVRSGHALTILLGIRHPSRHDVRGVINEAPAVKVFKMRDYVADELCSQCGDLFRCVGVIPKEPTARPRLRSVSALDIC